MLGQSDSLSISSKLCRYKLSIKFVTTIRNFHALREHYLLYITISSYKNDKLERPTSSNTRMCFFIIVNELFVYSGISLNDWKKKEFYILSSNHHPPWRVLRPSGRESGGKVDGF
jgi:hypothetical protein